MPTSLHPKLVLQKAGAFITHVLSLLVSGVFFRGRVPGGERVERVLVLNLDNAADVVFSTLLMPAVRARLGCARLSFAVNRGLGAVVEASGFADSVVEIPYGAGHCRDLGGPACDKKKALEALCAHIGELRPQAIIDLRTTPLGIRAALAARKSGARYRVTLDRVRLLESVGIDGERGAKWRRHEAATFFNALSEAGMIEAGLSADGSLSFWDGYAADKETIERLHGPRAPYMVIQPGAKWEFNRWPATHFASLIDTLAAALPDISFALVGTKDEKEACSSVLAALGAQAAARTADLSGRTSLKELIDLVAGSEMTVANDSGVAHISGALGKKTVVLFGPSNPERFSPLAKRTGLVRVFYGRAECSPCAQIECRKGPDGYCLSSIKPSEVASCILGKLEASKAPAAGRASR